MDGSSNFKGLSSNSSMVQVHAVANFQEDNQTQTQWNAPLQRVPATSPPAVDKVGVLLLNLGGPDKLDDVQPFLYNLFHVSSTHLRKQVYGLGKCCTFQVKNASNQVYGVT